MPIAVRAPCRMRTNVSVQTADIMGSRLQVRAALVQWAGQHAFSDAGGEPLFLTGKRMTQAFNTWLNDAVDDDWRPDFSRPVNEKSVLHVLGALHTDQLCRGDRYGLQKAQGGKTNMAVTWNFSVDFCARGYGGRFEHEMRKRMFAHADPGGDKDAVAAASAMTPVQHTGLKPNPVIQIAHALALAGSCAAAPDLATLATVARDVVRKWQQAGAPQRDEAPSPPTKAPAKQRRRGGGYDDSTVKSPHVSPHVLPPELGLDLVGQIRDLAVQMVRTQPPRARSPHSLSAHLSHTLHPLHLSHPLAPSGMPVAGPKPQLRKPQLRKLRRHRRELRRLRVHQLVRALAQDAPQWDVTRSNENYRMK